MNNKTLANLGAALSVAFLPAAAEAQSAQRRAGPEFNYQVSSKEVPGGRRTVGIDCDLLIPATNAATGQRRLGPTVAFIALFDAQNSPEYMATLSPTQRMVINGAKNNRSVNATQIEYMMAHVYAAHGVQYSEIRNAGVRCEPYFGITR